MGCKVASLRRGGERWAPDGRDAQGITPKHAGLAPGRQVASKRLIDWGRRRAEAGLGGDGGTMLGPEPALGFRDGPTIAQDPLDRVARAWHSALRAPRGGTGAGMEERRAAVRLEEARPGCSEGRVCSLKQDHLPYFPAEEAVDAAREDVRPNAHGSDRRRAVQRDRLCCSESGLQSHHS